MSDGEKCQCVNCGKDYISTDFIEVENEIEIDGEWIKRKDYVCVECYYGK